MMNPHSNGKDLGDQGDVPEGIDEVGAFLKRWRDPVVDGEAKAGLIAMLAAEMDAQEKARQEERAHSRAPLQGQIAPRNLGWAWLLLRSQTRLVHPVTWLASGLVIALGGLVTLLLYQPAGTTGTTGTTGAELPLVIVAPLVAACGVAFLYGLEADPALELLMATPVPPRLILLARLALLFGFNLAITLVCSVVLTLTHAQLSLIPLIAAWLAPMTFLSALAFLLSVIFFDALASVLISLLLWIGVTLRHFV
ncbi:MAG: hypothetical protein ABI700_21300, partial [Chloroflexota bacterium]